ncbi:MAG: hypothetical protein AMXMBFR7_18090 [Planctomycetota bacterium]
MDTRELTRICGSFRTALRGLLMQAGLARMAVLGFVLLPLAMAVDWWVHLEPLYRALVLIGWVAALAVTAWWTLLLPLRKKWSDREVLNYLDAVAPGGAGMLLELLELTERKGIQETDRPQGKALAEAALRELSDLPAQTKLAAVFVRGRVMRWVGAAVVVAGLFGLGAVVSGDYFSIGVTRFFNPLSKQRWPHRTTIAVQDLPEEGTQVPQMEAFTVKAEVTGEIPPQVTLAYTSASTGFTIKEKISVGEDGRFSYTFPEVREPLELWISGGDYVTDRYHIGVVERPYVTKITANFSYPTYAGLPDKAVEGGQLTGLEGTKVKLVFEVSIPLQKALFVPEGKPAEEMIKAGENAYQHEVMLKDGDTGYAIELYDPHGYREPKPERYEIRVIPDHPPEVEMLAPGEDLAGTKTVGFEVAFRAKDDFGLQSVEFLYALDNGEPKPLTDHITGPIVQQGRTSEARFFWDLRKMEALPESGTLHYFVRIQDINPTGRGKAETTRFQVKLLKPTDFHLEAFEGAKGIMAEGLIAWRNQLDAWKQGQQWLKSGTGKEDDAAWSGMHEKQDAAIRAAKAMEGHLRTLTKQYENNHMEQEFMAARVSQVNALLQKIIAEAHDPIASSLRGARPKTQADAAESKQKDLRAKALGEAAGPQKLAVLMLDRLVRKVFDWRDLQTATIQTSTILDRQEEITALTETLAPKTIGKEFEDLQSDEQDKLVTLGKQQQANFDAETQLELQLSQQMFKAKVQKRDNVRAPLEAAFTGLRSARVNDSLKDAAKRIEDNQPSAIVAKQKLASQVLRAVKGGLVLAGQKPDPEEPLRADLAVNEDPKFEDAQVAEKDPKQEDQNPESASTEDEPLNEEDLLKTLPTGSDPLSTALSQALERQEDVLSRARYLSSKDAKSAMPRFLKLRTDLLRARQDAGLSMLDAAIEEARKGKAAAVELVLNDLKAGMEQSRQLITGRHWGEHVQHLQADTVAALNDLLQFVAFRRGVEDAVAENKRQNGMDSFQRQFLLRGSDLDIAAEMTGNLQESLLHHSEAVRQAKRFEKHLSPTDAIGKFEQDNRARGASRAKRAAVLLKEATGKASGLTPEAAAPVKEASLDGVKDLKLDTNAEALAAGGKDAELAVSMEEDRKALANALQALRDQFEARVKPPEEAAPAAPEQPVTQEDFEKSRSPETLAEKVKANPNLPPAIKEKMIEILMGELPKEHKELLIEYYSSFAEQGVTAP